MGEEQQRPGRPFRVPGVERGEPSTLSEAIYRAFRAVGRGDDLGTVADGLEQWVEDRYDRKQPATSASRRSRDHLE